jgi:hypothetical protein
MKKQFLISIVTLLMATSAQAQGLFGPPSGATSTGGVGGNSNPVVAAAVNRCMYQYPAGGAPRLKCLQRAVALHKRVQR